MEKGPLAKLSSWRDEYKQKEIRPDDLNRIIKPGSRIFIGTACSEPIVFTRELVHDKYRWTDCEIIHFLTISDQKFFSEHYPTRFRHNTLSILGSDVIRWAVNTGLSDYTPIKTSEIPGLLKSRALPIDVALIQVSLPDKYGFCSLGINVDINATVVKTAKLVIAHINPRMPYTRGESSISIGDIDFFLYEDIPLLEMEYTFSPFEKKQLDMIGPYVARLIENGSTLNIGLGKIPNGIWRFLEKKSDLAVYSEVLVLSDAFFHLVEMGVINCKRNNYPVIMASFVLGKIDHYSLIDQNPFIKLFPTEFMNSLLNIAKNSKMCSIYTAVSVDLTGQITNHLPNQLYGGIGGEPDFIQGTGLSQDGKTIIVLPSCSKDGRVSRIIPKIERGTIPDYEVHYVVTEWGIARLGGKSLRERALQLIGVAHPDFRKDLLQQAKELHYIYKDQILPTTQDGIVVVLPEHCEWEFSSKSKGKVSVRLVKPTDEGILQRFYYHLDEKDRILRFLSPRPTFTHEDAQSQVNIDYDSTMAIIALAGDEDHAEIIGAASYYKEPTGSHNVAEVAVAVSSEWQGQGIGVYFFDRLIEIAQERGVAGFFGEVLLENVAMLRLLQDLPFKVVFDNYGDTLGFSVDFSDRRTSKTTAKNLRDIFMEMKNPL